MYGTLYNSDPAENTERGSLWRLSSPPSSASAQTFASVSKSKLIFKLFKAIWDWFILYTNDIIILSDAKSIFKSSSCGLSTYLCQGLILTSTQITKLNTWTQRDLWDNIESFVRPLPALLSLSGINPHARLPGASAGYWEGYPLLNLQILFISSLPAHINT